jgi:hypothetical protein
MGRRPGPRVALFAAILTLVTAGVGLVAMLILNAFVLDEYDAYGEIPIPGSSSLYLPAGEVTISFHTMVTGRPSSGFPIPELRFSIDAPEGVAKPQVAESVGGTTTVNSDTHVQVWVVQIAHEGTYDIVTDGNVNGYIKPRLAFGHSSSYGWLTWVFGGLLALGVLELVAALFWSARSARKAMNFNEPTWNSGTPSEQGMRLEQIRQLAALRDSGALTQAEFEAEKRRLLDT